jgi:hypothetical protein
MSPHDPRLPIPAAIFARLSSRSLSRVSGRSEARRRPSNRRTPGSRTHPRRLAVHRIPARSRGFIADSVRCRLPPCAQQSTPSASSSESQEISAQGMHQLVVTSQGPAGVDLSPGVQRGRFRGTAQTRVSSSGRDRGGSDALPDLPNHITPLTSKTIRLFRIFSPAWLESRPGDGYTTSWREADIFVIDADLECIGARGRAGRSGKV